MEREILDRRELHPRLPQGRTPVRLTRFPPGENRCGWSVLVLPGGAYQTTAPREGAPVAEAFARAGISSYVLDYSVSPDRWPLAFLEGAAAMELIREREGGRVAVCGFSAGGHLAGCLANLWSCSLPGDTLGLYPRRARPDAAILCYPVITAGAFGAGFCLESLTGSALLPAELEVLSLEKSVREDNPPAFLWCTGTDQTVPMENTLLYAGALRRAGVPFELHVYPQGPHAMALADGRTRGRAEQQDPHVASWFPLCLDWLKGLK